MTKEHRPKTLDGASVQRSADLSGLLASGRVTVAMDGKPIREPVYLAIGQYESEGDCYLFYCSAEWSVLAAGHYESQSAAEHAAERDYPGISAQWATHD
jgi:hypothetical protein